MVNVSRVMAGLLALGCSLSPVAAQTVLPGTIKFIHSGGSGGASDTALRMIGQVIAENRGPTLVMEYRTGAAQQIGLAALKNSPPDGTTIGMCDSTALTINPSLLKDLAYNPRTDFAPIATFMKAPMLLGVPTSLGVSNMAELVAYAKKKPGGLTYATQAVGGAGQLLGAYLAKIAGYQATLVPFRGTSPATTELIVGRVDMFFNGYTGFKAFHEAGQVKLLATTGEERDSSRPEIPTVREAGYPELEGSYWFGICAPANTPPTIINALYEHVARAVRSPVVQQRYVDLGMVSQLDNPEQFRKLIGDGIAKMKPIVEASGASMN